MQTSSSGPSAKSNSSPWEQSVGLTPSLSLSAVSGNSPTPTSLMPPFPSLDLGGGPQASSGEGKNFEGLTTPEGGFFVDLPSQADIAMDQYWSDEPFKWM